MAVKIIIKRIVPETIAAQLLPILKELRTLANQQPGYISGETLARVDKPGESIVISTWQSMDDWRRWVLSQERKAIQARIDRLLGQTTEYAIYEYS